MISKRTLEKWRKEALAEMEMVNSLITMPEHKTEAYLTKGETLIVCSRVLELTRVLLDQHLLVK